MAKAKVDDLTTLTGYVMKTKTKGAPLHDAVIDKVSNKFIAKGHDGSKAKNKISTIVSAAKAEACIEAGTAQRGEGWDAKSAKKKKG